MNYKKILVTLMLLVILTISAVNASDDADNLTVSEDAGNQVLLQDSIHVDALSDGTENNDSSNFEEDNNATGNGTNGTGTPDANDTGNGTEAIVPIDPALEINVDDIEFGCNATVVISTNETFSGEVLVQIADDNYTVSVTNGSGTTAVSDLASGNYTAKAIIQASESFLASENYTTFVVKKINSTVALPNIVFDYKGSGNATAVLTGASGINAYIEGYPDAVSVDGNVITVSGLDIGNYTLYVTTIPESENYEAVTVTSNVTVNKLAPTISITNEARIVVGSKLLVSVEVGDATGIVSINGNNITLVDGKANDTISGLIIGEHEISVIYYGDDIYLNGSETSNVVVYAKADSGLTVSVADIKAGENAIVKITINENVTGDVSVNGEKVEVVGGKASKTISGLAAGTYSVEVEFAGDKYFKSAQKTVKFNVVAPYPKIVFNKAASVLYTGKYSVKVYKTKSKVAAKTTVKFYIDNKLVKTVKTNKNGVASFNIPAKYAPNKKYTIKATALGKSASKKVTVKQIITTKAGKVKKSAKKVVITATLKKVDGKYLKGKKLTLRLNGKNYYAKTSKKGVAKFTIKKSALKKLKVGAKYIYKVTYSKAFVKKTVKIYR
ncbi:hypothetical protein [Methanobrevibacter sp.]|uniref:hypothetical protein n=1 Tax=Methanobrevibacter sp. TaxID=66852 RepID=UPI00386BCABC